MDLPIGRTGRNRSEPRLEGGVQPRPAPPARLRQCSPRAGPWRPCPHLLLGLPPHLLSPHLAQLVPLASRTSGGPAASSLCLCICGFRPQRPPFSLSSPASLSTLRGTQRQGQTFLWSWPGQPRGSREAVTWPQSLQAETRWVAGRARSHPSEMGFATCGDFAQGTLGTAWGHSWWPERGSPGTGRAEDRGSAERHARPWTSGAPRLGRPPRRCGKWGSGGAPGAPQDTLRLTLPRGRPCAASLCLSSGPIPKNRRHVPLRSNRGQPFLPTWWPSRHPDCLSTLPPWGPAQGWWTQRADAWVPSSLCSNCNLSGLSFPLYKRDSWGHSSGAGPRPVLMPSL